MASPPPSWFAGTSKINEADQSDPQQPIHFDPTQPILLEPTPLRSEPYIPPTMDLSENIDFEEQMEQVMIVLPTHSTIEEKNKILETNESAIILTGAAAALAQGGPTVGSVDIGENEDSYLFRVSIPGALKEDSEI
ncbi:alpha-crystallin domain-containing protein 22.3-like isoform X2 [Malus domestica]|uniref:alpha-crystallin domain-containing protein 22.3-like isoform X2 n=1 Tax=Malus domestica TaxID=3750 RepID=UPI0039755DB5